MSPKNCEIHQYKELYEITSSAQRSSKGVEFCQFYEIDVCEVHIDVDSSSDPIIFRYGRHAFHSTSSNKVKRKQTSPPQIYRCKIWIAKVDIRRQIGCKVESISTISSGY